MAKTMESYFCVRTGHNGGFLRWFAGALLPPSHDMRSSRTLSRAKLLGDDFAVTLSSSSPLRSVSSMTRMGGAHRSTHYGRHGFFKLVSRGHHGRVRLTNWTRSCTSIVTGAVP